LQLSGHVALIAGPPVRSLDGSASTLALDAENLVDLPLAEPVRS
jgi:hypothetical protein